MFLTLQEATLTNVNDAACATAQKGRRGRAQAWWRSAAGLRCTGTSVLRWNEHSHL